MDLRNHNGVLLFKVNGVVDSHKCCFIVLHVEPKECSIPTPGLQRFCWLGHGDSLQVRNFLLQTIQPTQIPRRTMAGAVTMAGTSVFELFGFLES